MGAAVAPAIGTAFGSGAISSIAAAPVFSAVAAAPIASAIATPAIFTTPAALGGGLASSGGLMGGLTSAFNAIKPYMSLINAGTQVLQGYQAYQSGQAQAAMYRMQALELKAKNEKLKVDAIRQSNLAYRKYLEAQSGAIAYGYAGGVSGFSGSALLAQTVGGKRLGTDIYDIQYNNMVGQTFGNAQASLLSTAAESASTGSYYDLMIGAGKGIYAYEQTRVPT
jgi:hypothetical protein